MQAPNPPRERGRTAPTPPPAPERLAISETELAGRWGIAVKTLRRWRHEAQGPVFCKLGARVVYLISEITAFEQRNARYGTGVRK